MPEFDVVHETAQTVEAIYENEKALSEKEKLRLVATEAPYRRKIRTNYYRLFDLQAGASGRLLDAGCGVGIEISNFQQLASGIKCYGVDISTTKLEAAVRGLYPRSRPAVFARSGLEFLPFQDGFFDYVSMHEVIEHIGSPATALAEVFRVLRPGGKLVVATPNGGSLYPGFLFLRAKRLMGRRGEAVGFDDSQPISYWVSQFRESGFKLRTVKLDSFARVQISSTVPTSLLSPAVRIYESLSDIPILNRLFCDHVKFALEKPETTGKPIPATEDRPGSNGFVCPICHAKLEEVDSYLQCGQGHSFRRDGLGISDFTQDMPKGNGVAGVDVVADEIPKRRFLSGRVGRRVKFLPKLVYGALLLAMLPLGVVVTLVRNPNRDVMKLQSIDPQFKDEEYR